MKMPPPRDAGEIVLVPVSEHYSPRTSGARAGAANCLVALILLAGPGAQSQRK